MIFVPGYYTEVGLIARQARELGITVPLLGGDGWDSPSTVEIGGDAVNGCYFSNHYAADDPNPIVQKFVEKLHARSTPTIPDAMAVLGYDAAQVLADAIRAPARPTAAKLRDAIAATKDFPGVTGKITIDDKRNARKSTVVLKIDGGKVKFFQRSSPDSRRLPAAGYRQTPDAFGPESVAVAVRERVPPAARQRPHLGQRSTP